jgi:bacterioferritin-associated ferredoxin
MPATEASRLLGLGHSYRHSAGGWVPDLGADGRCAIPGLFLAGDSTGILGAEAAAIGGRLAGLAAARDAGALNAASFDARARTLRKSHAATRRFAAAVSDLIALRPGLLNQTTPNTVVCRCEDVPRADIEAAAARGARTLNQLKSATRCGMGPCQGRLCGEAAAEILMRATGAGRASVGQWTARPPLRPLDVHAMVGSFGYGDIEMPPAAPG